MPIYKFTCKCGREIEKICEMGGETPLCSKCGGRMLKRLTFPAMVKVKGDGGYPSRRKEFRDTAPYYKG